MDLVTLLANRLSRLCRNRLAYVWLISTVQLGLFTAAGMASFLLRFEFSIPREMQPALWWGTLVFVTCKALVFRFYGLDRGMWRYFNVSDTLRVATASLVASVLSGVIITAALPVSFPRSVIVLDFLVSTLFSIGVRAGVRLMLELATRGGSGDARRIFIYGGGAGGSVLLHEVRSNAAFRRTVCGFIDDDPHKLGMMINAVPVRGGGAQLRQLAAAYDVQEVLIAVPSASGAQMKHMVQHCQLAGIPFRTMPAISEMVEKHGSANMVRQVALEDLLGRSVVELDRTQIVAKLRGRVVIVTGAAGSIGSELCRQVARFEPASLVVFDIAETALFHLENELRRRFPMLQLQVEIGSIQNRQRLCEVFRRHSPAVVYHAAAYKHVPMMEAHSFEAVENNVLGTYNVAQVAAEFEVEDFVMISSDKAVRPTNMMGATKRVAELMIRSLQNGGPRYVSVRFGNVLGSNGSVVPIFQKQIAEGGPVTVTHPEMERYFMTIPEAAQLVLQASTMGNGGEIFVLDMGKPVRIVDLARQLILLSGLKPDQDIAIEFVGTRPGEKLYEEINMADEHMLPTPHERIKVFAGSCLSADSARHHLAILSQACESRDLRALLTELKRIVPDYTVSRELIQKVMEPDLARLAKAVDSDPTPVPIEDGVLFTSGV
ncbi:MAG TPA: nucleoside-diphosphate sugar epimerase/dehydratase [Candidatus Acidoferrum sp.]|nr:nucleoside-diphosphate sugar epimerase/dehydratase [Candidatus Acidoferrum sp.]